MTEESTEDRLQMWVAILIALATVIGGLVAWRASVAEDAAGDADFSGLHATVNVNETRALNFVNAYENYGAFVTYWRNKELGNLIADDQAALPEDQAGTLEEARATTLDMAQANQELFSSKYLDRKGTYNLQRQLGEMWADASREKDMNPEPQFQEADRFRAKTNHLLLALLVLAIAPVFYSLVEALEGGLQKLALAGGTLFLIAGTVLAILFETGIL